MELYFNMNPKTQRLFWQSLLAKVAGHCCYICIELYNCTVHISPDLKIRQRKYISLPSVGLRKKYLIAMVHTAFFIFLFYQTRVFFADRTTQFRYLLILKREKCCWFLYTIIQQTPSAKLDYQILFHKSILPFIFITVVLLRREGWLLCKRSANQGTNSGFFD